MQLKKFDKLYKIDRVVHLLRPKILQYVLSALLINLIAISRTGLTSRFPGEDLFWNDLQLYNSWRWFSETANNSGILSTFSSVVDFRQNTGELFAASSKWPNPVLDMGSWLTYILGNYSLAFYLKFATLAAIGGYGLYKLLEENKFLQPRKDSHRLVVFVVLYSSIIFHPLFHGEVGPLNQWYLLLVPNWFHILIKITEDRKEKFYVVRPYFLFISILSLGSSDLFLISSITAIFSIFIISNLAHGQLPKGLPKYYVIFFCIFLIDKSFYLRESIFGNSQISSKGSWGLGEYTSSFLVSLIREGTLFPVFVGPVTLFVNLIVFVMILQAYKNGKNTGFTIYLVAITITTILLILAGFTLHGVSAIREQLPSAVRYHLTFVPFALISMLAFSSTLDFKGALGRVRVSKFVLIPLATFTVLILNIGDYGGIVPTNSNYILSKATGDWYMRILPNCINDKIDSTIAEPNNRSFTFVKPSGTGSAMDDTLLFLSEQPQNLKGRTFQQWRYSTGILNENLLSNVASSGLFTRPLLSNHTENILRFAETTNSPFIVSTEKISISSLTYLGSCDFPSKLDSVVKGNLTLGQSVHVYFIKAIDENQISPIKRQKFFSDQALFTIACNNENCAAAKPLEIPLNFSEFLRIQTSNQSITIIPNPQNAVQIIPLSCCEIGQEIVLKITSYSSLNFYKNLFLVFLILISLSIFSLSKTNRVSRILRT